MKCKELIEETLGNNHELGNHINKIKGLEKTINESEDRIMEHIDQLTDKLESKYHAHFEDCKRGQSPPKEKKKPKGYPGSYVDEKNHYFAKRTMAERSGSVLDIAPSKQLMIDSQRASYGDSLPTMPKRLKSKSIGRDLNTHNADLKMPAITERKHKLNNINIKNILIQREREANNAPIFVKFERFGKDFD